MFLVCVYCYFHLLYYTPDVSWCEGESTEDIIDAPPPAKRIRNRGKFVMGKGTILLKTQNWHRYVDSLFFTLNRIEVYGECSLLCAALKA